MVRRRAEGSLRSMSIGRWEEREGQQQRGSYDSLEIVGLMWTRDISG